MVMNSSPPAPHVHHYSYPPDHGMLINIYRIQFVFRERERRESERKEDEREEEGGEWGGCGFDLMEQVDRNKEAGIAKGVRAELKKGNALQNRDGDN